MAKRGRNIRRTKEEFVAEAIAVHGDKYTYQNFIYVNCWTPGYITCKTHGDFLQKPLIHINLEGGCIECGYKSQAKKKADTREQFIEKAIKKHGNKYSYLLVEYVNRHKDVILIHNICQNQFLQTPNTHLLGSGCSHCFGSTKRTTETFVAEAKEIHGDRYSYLLSNYINANTPVVIICSIHKEFQQRPSKHLSGRGCPKCGGTALLTSEEVIERATKIHGNKYIYDRLIYVNMATDVWIKCPDHGYFEKSMNGHINGGEGCPQCSSPKNEQIVGTILNNFKIPYVHQYKINLFNAPRSNRVDYYLPDYNLIIEYNGEQHYELCLFKGMSQETAIRTYEYQVKRDIALRKYCFDNDIALFEIDGRKYKGTKLIKYLEEQFTEAFNHQK
jgi:hypothetical protein